MANHLEHFWFLPYSIEVKNFLTNTLYLSSYPDDMNVGVYYTTPARAFAKFIVPVINGSNLSPTVTFHLTGHAPAQGQMPGGYFTKYQKSKTNDQVWETIRHPLPYELNYRVTMWTARQSDMDILLYQAMTAAPFNRKYAKIVEGQWMDIEVTNTQEESNLEPGEAQDLSVRYGFDIKISRAYLPLDYEEYYGIIMETDVYTSIQEKLDIA